MRVGVIADTHDNLDALKYWVDVFNQNDAEVLLHAGDVISPFCVAVLSQFEGPVHVTFGNNDGDRKTLRSKAEGTDVQFENPPLTLDLDGYSMVMVHKPKNLPEDLSGMDCAIHGHTHERRIDEGGTTILNPGEAGGWLSGTSSALELELKEGGIETSFKLVPAP